MSSTTGNQIIRERVEKSNQVLKYADESRKAGILTDVCIKAGRKNLPVHRLVLSSYSGYFRTMFLTEMEERYAHTVTIKGVDETSLEALIEFIYTGKISINQEDVFDLLAASDYLQIDEAKQFCFDFLFDLISVETCFKVLNMADLYQNNNLLNETHIFIAKNFRKVSSQSDFKRQSKQNLIGLISRLNTNRVGERLVYDAIIGWVKYHESREDDFPEVFQCLDLSRFSASFLAKTVSNDLLVVENHTCSNLVMKTLAMKLQERASNNPTKILSIGGWETASKVFVVYNDDQKTYPALPYESFGHFSLKLDDFVYCIGGGSFLSPANNVCRLKVNETDLKWEKVASMKFPRHYCDAAVYKSGIAVTGGTSLDAGESVEFYNPSFNQWLALPSTAKGKHFHSLVTCDECLFCLGGISDDGNRYLSSVEMLSDVNGIWRHVQSMQTPRSEFAAVNCMGTIYAIGGCNSEHNSMKSVEKYDSTLNKWVFVKEMNTERCGHSACVMQDEIFVVGGRNINNDVVYEIECYDPLNDNWSIVGNANEKLIYHSIVAI